MMTNSPRRWPTSTGSMHGVLTHGDTSSGWGAPRASVPIMKVRHGSYCTTMRLGPAAIGAPNANWGLPRPLRTQDCSDCMDYIMSLYMSHSSIRIAHVELIIAYISIYEVRVACCLSQSRTSCVIFHVACYMSYLLFDIVHFTFSLVSFHMLHVSVLM